jgi:hypothetical protein
MVGRDTLGDEKGAQNTIASRNQSASNPYIPPGRNRPPSTLPCEVKENGTSLDQAPQTELTRHEEYKKNVSQG